MKNSNIPQVLYLLIKQLKVPVTRQSIDDELQKHQNGYSLLTVSNVLDGSV